MKSLTNTPIRTLNNQMVLSRPVTAHIELTTACNLCCRHCYNFWRHQDAPNSTMKLDVLDRILDELLSKGVMHVIFTGGEPFLAFPALVHGIAKMVSAGASVSCNSNLRLATDEKVAVLKAAGLPHILTSLNSYDAEVNDHLISSSGAHESIINGIKATVRGGLNVSVNMIISESNIEHIYETGRLVASLGAKKFFATRVVPSVTRPLAEQSEFLITPEKARYTLDQITRVRDDFGLVVGTLIPFPYCFMKDLDKFEGFYSHGCPAGNKMISINADGKAHACVHEDRDYGNILEIGLDGVWKNMELWRDGSIIPEDCQLCPAFEDCNGACRMCAQACNERLGANDNLKVGWKASGIARYYENDMTEFDWPNLACRVAAGLRFRPEGDFIVVNRFGSEMLCVEHGLGEFLEKHQKDDDVFIPAREGVAHEIIRNLIDQRLIDVQSVKA